MNARAHQNETTTYSADTADPIDPPPVAVTNLREHDYCEYS